VDAHRRRRAQQNRRILQAAVGLFADAGYHETRRADIAFEASMPLSTLEYYFHDKDALFDAVLDAVLARSLAAVGAALFDTPEEERLPTFLRADIAWWAAHRHAARLIARQFQSSDWPAVRRLFADWERERQQLAYGQRGVTRAAGDSRAADALRRQARQIVRLRLVLDLVLHVIAEQASRCQDTDLFHLCLDVLADEVTDDGEHTRLLDR